MYLRHGIFALVVGTSALPNPPTVFNPDGSRMDAGAPTVFNPDGTRVSGNNGGPFVPPGSLEGFTKSQEGSVNWNGPPEKYFHESTFDGHYDGRYADRALPPDSRNTHLRALLRTYLATMHALGAETWLMHGSLLGWWWNHRIMPWDSDIDVQVSEPALAFLAAHYNMSVHTYQDVDWLGNVDMGGRDVGVGRKSKGEENGEAKREYLLEINPHWKNGSYADKHNVIDGRWIDMKTGLYIDITSVRLNASSPVPGTLYCKDRHHYLTRQIFPLRTSVFEGVPAKIPYAYQELLAEEYGVDSLVETVFRQEGYFFDKDKKEWVGMWSSDAGTWRQNEKLKEDAQRARKKAGGRKKPAKSNARGGEMENHLKPKIDRRVNQTKRRSESVWTVVWRLVVGV